MNVNYFQKTISVLTMTFLGLTVNAQNALPANGNVGIGTASPSSSLEVMGETNLQGKLFVNEKVIIKDCVLIEKNLNIDQDVKVKGEGIFTEQLKAKADLKVLGVTKMKGDAFVEGDFKFKNLEDQSALEDRILMINKNGKATALDKAGFVGLMYDPVTCFVLPNGNVPAPVWSSEIGISPNPGTLYTGANCPALVGIGTASPEWDLDVRGNTYISNYSGIGIQPNQQVQLYIEPSAPTQVGLCVDMPNSSDYNYAFKARLNNDNVKGFAISRIDNGNDVFNVYGNGQLNTESINISNVSSNVFNQGARLFVEGETYLAGPLEFSTQSSDYSWNTWDASIITPMGGSWVTNTVGADGNYKNFGMTQSGWFFGLSPENIGSTNTDIKYATFITNNGKIVTREVEVTLDGWSDFVFEDEYELLPIDEVEKFINKNNHLPNVPSEKEVLENGINLGEMDAILLRKIEELTLYIIQLENKINSSK